LTPVLFGKTKNLIMLNVHSIESMGTYDGPGIRLVVFVQGCGFRCLYCANPDTISHKGGKQTETSELVKLADSQRPFFGKLGGVTVSGGEPILQAKGVSELFQALKKEDINTCIDTNGNAFNDDVKEMLEHTDLVLLDIKHIDPVKHKVLTERENATPLKFADYLQEKNIRTCLRYVLVPGYSDQEESLHDLGKHFANREHVERIEIQPYHQLGVHKYEHLDMEYKLEGVPENSPEQIEKAKTIFEQYFKEVIVN